MKRLFIYILTVIGLLGISCSPEYHNDPDVGPKAEQISFAAINLNNETTDADIMLLCSNGSYMLCDVNKDNKCGMIYINNSIDNDMEEGITIYVDSTGTPIMLQSMEGEFLFQNVTETSCDIAFRDKDGNISYFWDISLTEEYNPSPMKTPASWTDPVTYPFTNWWHAVSTFDWAWDDAQRRAIIPFMAKVGSFATTAVGMVVGTPLDRIVGLKAFFEEANKSGLFEGHDYILAESIANFLSIIEIGDAYDDFRKTFHGGDLYFTSQKIGLSVLANALNEYGDQGLANLYNFEESTQDIFANKDYQIRLSTNVLECSAEEKTYMVDVNTKSYWTIDVPQNEWCRVRKSDDNKIIVDVTAYEGVEDRVCSTTIKTISEEIPAAILTIKQTGVIFSLSETELIFVGKNASKGVYVTTNDNVRSWDVVAVPNWLKVEKAENSFFLTTDPSFYDGITVLNGEVSVEATMKDASNPISRIIQVQWVPRNEWDGTKWAFSGTVTTNAPNVGIELPASVDFTLTIVDVANNNFSWNSGGETYYGDISLDSDNQLNIVTTFRYSFAGYMDIVFSVRMTISRTGETTASCFWDAGKDSVSQYGTLNGILIEQTY